MSNKSPMRDICYFNQKLKIALDRQTDFNEYSVTNEGNPRHCRGFGARQVSKATTPKSMPAR